MGFDTFLATSDLNFHLSNLDHRAQLMAVKTLEVIVSEWEVCIDLGVSKNKGTPKSSILIGEISIINHPFWVPLFLETPI